MESVLPLRAAPLLFALLLSSCETTLDYGYYVGELNETSIEALFQVADEAVRNQDFGTYRDLFGPNYISVDRTENNRSSIYRADYLGFAEKILAEAKFIQIASVIRDIQIIEPGRKALVSVQEEELRDITGVTEHYTRLSDVEVGYEDGWIFFEKSICTASQTIQD